MTDSEQHPSQLMLDQYIAGALDEKAQAVEKHIASCERCHQRVEQMRSEYQAFLKDFPTWSAIEKRSASRQKAGPSRARAPRRRWFPWIITMAPVAAAAMLLIAVLYQASPPSTSPPGTSSGRRDLRAKGGSVLEIAVSRQGRSFRYAGEPLQAGDVLSFRYTTKHTFLLLMSLEQSGNLGILLADATRTKSMPIKPGKKVRIDQGLKLDDYAGNERLIAIFSVKPVEVKTVKKLIHARFKALTAGAQKRLALGTLPVKGEQLTWLLKKKGR